MNNKQVIEIKMSTGVKFIKLETIVFIKTAKRHTIITLLGNIYFEAFHNINWFEKELPKPDFCRCHNSYIIGCRHIFSIDYTKRKARMNGYGDISFSRKYKDILLSSLKKFIIEN